MAMVCLRVALLLAAVPLVAKAARAPAKGSPPRGFGSKPKPARTAVSVSLGYEAEKALREACGNIDKGQQLYYESKMREAGSDKSHATRVRVTWDTIAAFMPHVAAGQPNAVTPAVAKKLRKMTTEICASHGGKGRVLDVGCGSGLLLPSLLEFGKLAPSRFCGIDVSGEMIALAKQLNAEAVASGARFEQVSLGDACSRAAHNGERYHSIVFNGALQFFDAADVPNLLDEARRHLLLEEPGANIVLTHANGAAFVRDEAEGNPATVLSIMPSVRELQALADGLDLGLSVHGKTVSNEATNEELDELDARNERFYLAALMTCRM